jgi:sterol desaturase/sphingolipid hydroxylase (fatty acid hydroxylase superfamily)
MWWWKNYCFEVFTHALQKFYGIVAHWVLGLDVWKLGGVSIVVLVQESLVVMGKTFYGQGSIPPR